MASTLQPIIQTFLAGGTIAKGQPVKLDTDKEHVVACSAATDKIVGLAQGAATSGQSVEIAVDGGGKGKAGGNIALGDLLTSDGSGLLIATTTAGDRVIGVAMDAAVANDIFDVKIDLGAV